MTYLLNEPWLLGLLLAITLAAAIELGRRTAAHLHIHDDENRKEQIVAIRDGLFVLVSLLLGFTLALAVPRYNERRTLLVEEFISIGKTHLLANMLPQPYRDRDFPLSRDRSLQLNAVGRLLGHISCALYQIKALRFGHRMELNDRRLLP